MATNPWRSANWAPPEATSRGSWCGGQLCMRLRHAACCCFGVGEDSERPSEATPLLGKPADKSPSVIERIGDSISQLTDWHSDEKRSPPVWLQPTVESSWFDPAIIVVVVLNAILVGVRIDHPNMLSLFHFELLNAAFNLVYTCEIVGKWWVYGSQRFFSLPYNVFTFSVTLAVWSDLVVMMTLSRGTADRWLVICSSDVIQVLQLFRVWKLKQVFKELEVIIDTFASSVAAIGWVMLLGMTGFFLCACVTTAFIGHRDFGAGDNTAHGERMREIQQAFGSILHSMFTLFELMVIEGWPSIVRPFLAEHWPYVVCMVVFIMVANFFLLNVFTAIVVDNMLKKQLKAHDEENRNARERHRELVDDLYHRLREVNGEDNMSMENAKFWVESDYRVVEMIHELKWHREHFLALVTVCDADCNDEVSLRSLRDVFEDCGSDLSTKNYVKFQQHVAHRMDHVDELMQLVFKAAASLGTVRGCGSST